MFRSNAALGLWNQSKTPKQSCPNLNTPSLCCMSAVDAAATPTLFKHMQAAWMLLFVAPAGETKCTFGTRFEALSRRAARNSESLAFSTSRPDIIHVAVNQLTCFYISSCKMVQSKANQSYWCCEVWKRCTLAIGIAAVPLAALRMARQTGLHNA